MTLYDLDKLERIRILSDTELGHLHKLSNNVYDALDKFQMAEPRRDTLSRLMIEVAAKFLEKGL